MSRVFDDDPAQPEPEPDPNPTGRLRPVGVGLVVLLLVLGGLLGWFVVTVYRLLEASLPVTPWTLPPLLAVVGVAAAVVARNLSGRRPDPTTWDRWVAAFVTGRSMLAVGLLTAGAHVPYVLSQVPELPAGMPRDRLVWGGLAIVASVLFALGGWLLERACRVPDDPSQESGEQQD